MQKKNVLHVTQYIEIGGLETLIVEICKKMDKDLFKVSVLCLGGYDESYAADLREFGVDISVIKKNAKFDFLFFRRVCCFIRKNKIDVLHAHGGCFLYAAIFTFLSGLKKFIFTAHGMPLSHNVKEVLEDRIAGLVCNKIVAVSDEIKDTFISRIPWSKNKVSVIINGIDIDCFRPLEDSSIRNTLIDRYGLPHNSFIIGSVGRLESIKNYPMLLRAFAGLVQGQDGNAHLVLVGEGSQRSVLQALAEEFGVADRVTFLGMQYQVHEILPLFDVFVLSSLTEGTSISLLEAQACGVPAVVTDVGGNGAVVCHGENGFLCKLDDDIAMTQALSHLQTDVALVQRMGVSARERVCVKFDLNSMVRRYEQLYRRMD